MIFRILAKWVDFLLFRVRRLTPEQEARLPEFRDRWLKVGLSTESADRAAARMALDEVYRLAGLPPLEAVIFLGSPLAGSLGAAMLRHGDIRAWDWSADETGEDTADRSWLDARDGFRDRVREQIMTQTGMPSAITVGDPVDIRDSARIRVEKKVRAQVRATVRRQVWSDLDFQVGNRIVDPAWEHVWACLEDYLWLHVRNRLYDPGFGHHDADWLSFYSFLHEACGLDCCAPLAGYFRLAENCGWWWPFENVAILTERPRLLKRDEEHRLHCEDGPALAYPDGWSIWAWHGVRVPQDVIENPETLTAARIENEDNIEVRRAMIERIGMETWLEHSGAQEVMRDEVGILYRKDFDDDEAVVMVKVRNSSPEPDGGYKDYFLRVPPDIKTPREAVAWSFGLEEGEYEPGVET